VWFKVIICWMKVTSNMRHWKESTALCFVVHLVLQFLVHIPYSVKKCDPTVCIAILFWYLTSWTSCKKRQNDRVTTRPAFRGTVPKTYVKSRIPHFAWNVPQISFFIIYSIILNFRIYIFRFYVNSVTECFVPMVLFAKYNVKNTI
jgi:hypothetical protein